MGWLPSVAMLLAGSLLWGFSLGSWLAPLAAWIGPVLDVRLPATMPFQKLTSVQVDDVPTCVRTFEEGTVF